VRPDSTTAEQEKRGGLPSASKGSARRRHPSP
jgi:hypothetical protein